MAWRRRETMAAACVVGFGILVAPASALAKHVKELSGVLASVFLAENFAIVCSARNLAFLEATQGHLGPVSAYSRHMKGEVVAGLPPEELMAVLKGAADEARGRALTTLRSLDGTTPEEQMQRLDHWCATSGKDHVLRIIELHDREHAAFLQAITGPQLLDSHKPAD